MLKHATTAQPFQAFPGLKNAVSMGFKQPQYIRLEGKHLPN
jgi:hypothetical protein